MAGRSDGLKLITGIARAIDNVSKENRKQELQVARNRQKQIQSEMREIQAELKQLQRERIKQDKLQLMEQDRQLKLRFLAKNKYDMDATKFHTETQSKNYLNEHNRLNNLLKEVLNSKSVFDISTMKDKSFFQAPKPEKRALPLRQIFNFDALPPNP
jgi:hypothetical protein